MYNKSNFGKMCENKTTLLDLFSSKELEENKLHKYCLFCEFTSTNGVNGQMVLKKRYYC